MRPFTPQPAAGELPAVMPDPFRPANHPLVVRAATALRVELEASEHWPQLSGARGGKMFGVLVVRGPGGETGYLQAFAGRLGKRWTVDGFAPPVFAEREHDPRWIDGERRLAELELSIGALEYGNRVHTSTRAESLEEERQRRTRLSREALSLVQEVYSIRNWAGRELTVAELFAPARAPGGVGECAAPKLLAEARRRGLQPLAIGELWLGTAPPAGDREHGAFYPACTSKCARLIPYMLEGVPGHDAGAGTGGPGYSGW